MSDRVFNVLFLCTHNSARSVMAEAILNREGQGRFHAYSAGSMPSGHLNPTVAALLGHLGYDLSQFRSKSWDEFAGPDAPAMDFVITVCDNAAGEVCPVWPGHPVTAHWGFPDPSSVQGTETEKAVFAAEVFRQINNRLQLFMALPVDKLDHMSLQHHVRGLAQPPAGAA